MSFIRIERGRWRIECIPDDGARISRLQYDGFDLLTRAPDSFRPPSRNYGAYETRPVYGYDDCLPSVSACRFPGLDWEVPDHGEVCWLPWSVMEKPDGLLCKVESQRLPIIFIRRLAFADHAVEWHFRLENKGHAPLTVQHVMHPLMPVRSVASLRLPVFAGAWDELGDQSLPLHSPEAVAAALTDTPAGITRMWFLQKIEKGCVEARFHNGMTWRQEWPAPLFPTLAIWWNHGAYPDETGLRRHECALEPVPGALSDLALAGGLTVPAKDRLNWTVKWMIRK